MMRQDKQFDAFVITESHIEQLDKKIHYHNYYEFIFIKSGAGNHYKNGEVTPFTSGDLFFISPADQHLLEISTPSVIMSIRFTEYAKGRLKGMQKSWKDEVLPGLKKGRSLLNIKVTFSVEDLKVVEGIFNVFSALKDNLMRNETIIYLQLIALVSVIERNLTYGNGVVAQVRLTQRPKKSVESLLAYVNKHISKPELLTAKQMAGRYGYSVHYIGLYFKQHAGVTLQEYINQCRHTIIARKLVYGSLSITQLAADFNFTDVSHFNRSFKKYWGVTPSNYRMGKR